MKESHNLPEGASVVLEPRDCRHLVLQFHRRCQEALKSVLASVVKEGEGCTGQKDNTKVFTSIVDQQLQKLDMKLEQYQELF